jgi:hypothetical protein
VEAINTRHDERDRVQLALKQWEVQNICGFLGSAFGGEDAVREAMKIRLLDDDGELTAPRDTTHLARIDADAPETVRMGGQAGMMPPGAPPAPLRAGDTIVRPADLPDDPVALKAGHSVGIVSEESTGGLPLGNAEKLQQMFPGLVLAQLPTVEAPSEQQHEESGRGAQAD